MLALNQLPRLHHPLLTRTRFALVTRDKFFLVIGASDPKFSETETRKLLESIGGAHIELVEDDDALPPLHHFDCRWRVRRRWSASPACRGQLSRKPPHRNFSGHGPAAKLRPQEPDDFFTNGLSSQLPPAGTVARSAADSRPSTARFILLKIRRSTPAASPARQFCRNQSAARQRRNCSSAGASGSTFIARRAMAGSATATASPRKSASCPPWPICTTSASWKWPTARFSTPSPTAKA